MDKSLSKAMEIEEETPLGVITKNKNKIDRAQICITSVLLRRKHTNFLLLDWNLNGQFCSFTQQVIGDCSYVVLGHIIVFKILNFIVPSSYPLFIHIWSVSHILYLVFSAMLHYPRLLSYCRNPEYLQLNFYIK